MHSVIQDRDPKIHESRCNRLLSALTIAAALGGLTSCRVQNKSVFSQIVPSDDVSGFYETEIDAVQYCVQKSNAAQPVCKTSTTADTANLAPLIPPIFANVFSNPVAVVLQDKASGLSGFFSYRGGSGLPTIAKGDAGGGTLSYTGLYQPSQLWKDPRCLSQLLFEQDGTYRRYKNHDRLLNNVPVYGSLNVIGQVTETFFGAELSTDCTDTLNALYACYQDPNQCGGTATENPQYFAQVHAMFDPYVTAGVITGGDIPHIEQLIYAVQYLAPNP